MCRVAIGLSVILSYICSKPMKEKLLEKKNRSRFIKRVVHHSQKFVDKTTNFAYFSLDSDKSTIAMQITVNIWRFKWQVKPKEKKKFKRPDAPYVNDLIDGEKQSKYVYIKFWMGNQIDRISWPTIAKSVGGRTWYTKFTQYWRA